MDFWTPLTINVLCFFQVQGGYLYLISSTGSFASNNVFQSCHYPNDPIVNESKACGDCGRTTDIFFSPGSGSSLCSPNLSPQFSMGWYRTGGWFHQQHSNSSGAHPCVNQSDMLLWPDIQAQQETSSFVAAWISRIEPHLFLNDLSFSFGQHSSIQFSLGGGVDNLFTGSILCRNKSTAVVTFVKLLSDVGCKTIGEITSIAKDEQPWLPKWVWCRKQRSKLRYSR